MSPAPPPTIALSRRTQLALAGIVLGGILIGFSPILTRQSPVGPVATGFWRMFFSVPCWGLLWAYAARDLRGAPPLRLRDSALLLLPGLWYSGDLAFWNTALTLTSVSNASVTTNMAPIFVTAGAWFLFRERPRTLFLLGVAVAISGTLLLVSEGVQLGGTHVLGIACGLASAFFYGCYQLTGKALRTRFSAPAIMFHLSCSSTVCFFLLCLLRGEPFLWPAPLLPGFLLLFLLALTAQVAGQGLVIVGLRYASAQFTTATLLIEPVMATMLAWVFFRELLTPLQAVGCALVLGGIVAAQRFAAAAKPVPPAPALAVEG